MKNSGKPKKGYKLSWLESMGAALLKAGPIPRHIAIILDGNRRFARKMKMGSVTDGHGAGALKLEQVGDMFLHLGIPELTVYAFSIENFKRPQEEVDAIMKLMARVTEPTKENFWLLESRGLTVEVIGNLEDSPSENLKRTARRTMLLTKDHKKLKVNVAFIYTGRDEITRGCNTAVEALQKGHLETDHVTEQLFAEMFTLHPSNPVDIMIRTSGECRMSDFILWGCAEAYLEFVTMTWPEYTFWGLIGTILGYQNHIMFKGLKKYVLEASVSHEGGLHPTGRRFVDLWRKQKWSEMASNVTLSK